MQSHHAHNIQVNHTPIWYEDGLTARLCVPSCCPGGADRGYKNPGTTVPFGIRCQKKADKAAREPGSRTVPRDKIAIGFVKSESLRVVVGAWVADR